MGCKARVIGIVAFFILPLMALAANGDEKPDVRTLENGLRVVSWKTEPSNVVSLRLVVDGPSSPPGSYAFGVYTVLLQSMFESQGDTSSLFKFVRDKGGKAGLDVGHTHSVFSFDVKPEVLDSLFIRLQLQWVQGAVSSEQYDTGLSIALEERWPSPLVARVPGVSDQDDSRDWFDIATREVAELFLEHMVASRMSLVVVGGPEILSQIDRLVEKLEVVPAGSLGDGYTTSCIGFLIRSVKWPDVGDPLVVGLVVKEEDLWTPRETRFYFLAAREWLGQSLGREQGMFYSLYTHELISQNEHVFLFEPHADSERCDAEVLSRHVSAAMEQLADPASAEWWQSYTNGRRVRDGLLYLKSGDPENIADCLGELVGFPSGFERLGREEVYRPSPEEAIERFSELLDKSQYFVIEPATPNVFQEAGRLFSAGGVYVWRDLYGPDDWRRTLAFMCHCGLFLLVLRRVDGWAQRVRRS